MWRVIEEFTDSMDRGYRYSVGEAYPRDGYKPNKERIAELLGDDNRRGHALIEQVKPKTEKVEKLEKVEKAETTK